MRNIKGLNLFSVILLACFSKCLSVVFQSSPKNMVGKLGESISMVYKFDENADISLYGNGDFRDKIYSTPNLKGDYVNEWTVAPNVKSDSYNFTIKSLKKSDGKQINCIIDGTDIERNHSITVYDSPPTILQTPSGNFREGDKFKLTCTFGRSGKGIFTVKFYQNNDEVTVSELETKSDNDKITFIGNFTADYRFDRKPITCRVSTKDEGFPSYLGSDSINFQVTHKVTQVKISPDPSQSNIELKVGDKINCTASGNPDPKFEWRKKDENAIVKNEATLTVEKGWAGSERTYVCTALNTVGGQTARQNSTIKFKAIADGSSGGVTKSGTEAWKIAVATVGAILGLALIIGLIILIVVLRKKKQQPKPPIRSDASRSPNDDRNSQEPPPLRKPDNRVPADIPRSGGPTVGSPDSTPLYSELQSPKPYDNIPPSAYQSHNTPFSRAPYSYGDDSLASSNGAPPEISQPPRYIVPSGPQPRPSRPLRPHSGATPPSMRPSYNSYPPDTQV